MPRYPHTRLFICPRWIVVVSGPYIQVLDTASGHVVHSSANVAEQDERSLTNNGPIHCSGMSKDGKYLATAGDDKRLKVWELGTLTLLSARELPKKPTSIHFCNNTEILVSDKFGDVFRYKFHPNNETTPQNIAGNTGDILASHENPSDGELVLGHASLVTCCVLTDDERFIITADRDEHIRISWYPQGHVIESYCLGHKKYVSTVHVPVLSPELLISGGGDHELKIWEWMTGRLHQNIDVFAAVEPFIRVTPKVSRREARNDNNGDAPQTVETKSRRTRTEQRKGPEGAAMNLEKFEGPKAVESSSTSHAVLVIRRISSYVLDGEIHVIFSAVGATAIFGFILAETRNQPDIQHYDFGKPVIDFTVCWEGTIWVLLDADFPVESDTCIKQPHDLVQAIRWSIDKFSDAGRSKSLDSLNTICSLPATGEDLRTLDLYSDLSSLPKNIDMELDSRLSGQLASAPEPYKQSVGESATFSVGLTKRALGRLKHKRAIDQLHRENADNHDTINDTPSLNKKMKPTANDEQSHSAYSD